MAGTCGPHGQSTTSVGSPNTQSKCFLWLVGGSWLAAEASPVPRPEHLRAWAGEQHFEQNPPEGPWNGPRRVGSLQNAKRAGKRQQPGRRVQAATFALGPQGRRGGAADHFYFLLRLRTPNLKASDSLPCIISITVPDAGLKRAIGLREDPFRCSSQIRMEGVG